MPWRMARAGLTMSGNLNNLDRAIAGWGADLPAWIRMLANACDRTSQRQVAERIGKSHPYINRIVRNAYPGDLREAETLVRAAFGGEDVPCPAIGDLIPLSGCVRNRRRTAPPVNHLHQLWARNCPDCPFNTDAKDD